MSSRGGSFLSLNLRKQKFVFFVSIYFHKLFLFWHTIETLNFSFASINLQEIDQNLYKIKICDREILIRRLTSTLDMIKYLDISHIGLDSLIFGFKAWQAPHQVLCMITIIGMFFSLITSNAFSYFTHSMYSPKPRPRVTLIFSVASFMAFTISPAEP